jgi:hypothetical protein
MANTTAFENMRTYQAELIEAVNQVPRPPLGDAWMQVFAFVDLTARVVAQAMVALEETTEFTDKALSLFVSCVEGHVRDALRTQWHEGGEGDDAL